MKDLGAWLISHSKTGRKTAKYLSMNADLKLEIFLAVILPCLVAMSASHGRPPFYICIALQYKYPAIHSNLESLL